MRNLKLSLISLIVIIISSCSIETSETWEIDNLKEIGGHKAIVNGDPEVVETEIVRVVKFDGDGDMINPVGKLAIRGRMNHMNWFNRCIKTLRVTHSSLDPKDFIQLPHLDLSNQPIKTIKNQNQPCRL